jgi:integrase
LLLVDYDLPGANGLEIINHARELDHRCGTPIVVLAASPVEAVGIRDLHWRDSRHTFDTRLAEAGCSEATIASLMGHSDPQTTRRYTHATDRAKRAAVEAVRVLRENVCHKSATIKTAAKAGSRSFVR